MPEDEPEIGDLDFAGEMHQLACEAQWKASPTTPRLDRKDLMLALGQMVRPLALELENIKRATAENGVMLAALGKASKAAPAPPAESDSLDRINQQLQRLGAVETANQKLFDALHTELKGYKDNFLFDALQRPFIRDLVSIFDDFSAVHAQISKRLNAAKSPRPEATAQPAEAHGGQAAHAEDSARQSEAEFLRTLAGNMDNQVHHLLEVFLRMEVVPSQSPSGTAVDKKVHRTVAFEPAANSGEHGRVVRSLKPGFAWRERMIRPEEVVVYRWAAEPPSATENMESSPDAKADGPHDERRPASEAKSIKSK